MIHRKWSLLTGPMAILGGIVATTVVAHLLFVDGGGGILLTVCITALSGILQDPFLKPQQQQKKPKPDFSYPS